MKLAITGAAGFLGWHLRVRLRATQQVEALTLGREDLRDPERLTARLEAVDTVIHLAGVNRADSGDAVEHGNIAIAERLAGAIAARSEPRLHVVYANSRQAELDNPYGRGKARAAEILLAATETSGGTLADVRLPNVFGEHGRPHYNSFVATFCSEICQGRQPHIAEDRPVPLLHAQQAANALMHAAVRRETHQDAPAGSEHTVSSVLRLLNGFHEVYTGGEIPARPDEFTVALFNTYRSFMFPQHFPLRVDVRADQRGQLFEAVRSHGGPGQTFLSSTVPGMTRGDHYHLTKVERFFVVRGEAEIALRRVYDDEVVRFRVNGDDRCIVDMPTMWAHNIANVGNEELVTLFWADQLLDPAAPDTYRESVHQQEASQP